MRPISALAFALLLTACGCEQESNLPKSPGAGSAETLDDTTLDDTEVGASARSSAPRVKEIVLEVKEFVRPDAGVAPQKVTESAPELSILEAEAALTSLVELGKRDVECAVPKGVRVLSESRVEPLAPLGLKNGDRVDTLDGQPILGWNTPIAGYFRGRHVLGITRRGRQMFLNITIAE